jgi:fructose-1,6-bisphosphatase/inositol monophosphatase family enzyme
MGLFDRELQAARRAVLAAGESLLSWEDLPEEEWKGRIDPVSAADRQAEQAAISVLRDAFPDDLVVGEESTQLADEREVSGKRRWYLDPLDGTTNYLRGRPHWCVSLALVDSSDKAVCAAVLAPPTGDLFLAVRGGGATRSGERLGISRARPLDRAVVGSGFPYSFDDPSRTNLREWAAVTVEALAVRCSGAAALDLCDVARGRLDAFWEMELAPWDTVAGALIVREAGALTTRLDGSEILGAATEVLAAPSELHAEVLEVLYRARS